MQGTPDIDLSVIGKTQVGDMEVEIIEPVEVMPTKYRLKCRNFI